MSDDRCRRLRWFTGGHIVGWAGRNPYPPCIASFAQCCKSSVHVGDKTCAHLSSLCHFGATEDQEAGGGEKMSHHLLVTHAQASFNHRRAQGTFYLFSCDGPVIISLVRPAMAG